MNKGIIAINKPKDWTSFDVVNKIKHIVKPNKVGHLGTLDPMATGVLLVTVGKATKLFDVMQQKEKTYLAIFEFGYETDSLDATGVTQKTSNNIPTLEQIEAVLPKFKGKINQIPPKFSAKSVNGVRAYDLARRGESFELLPKQVEVFDIKIIEYKDKILKLEIVCGSGTYIRSIGRDIAYELNTYATMTELVRTKVGNFNLKNCKDINNLNSENVYENLSKLNAVLDYEVLDLGTEITSKLLNGQVVKIEVDDGNYFLNYENDIVAIVKVENFRAKMSIFLAWRIVKMKKIWYNTKVEIKIQVTCCLQVTLRRIKWFKQEILEKV